MKFILLCCLIVVVPCRGNNETSIGHRVTHKAWLDITTDGKYLGRIEIGLFGKIVPVTVQNFVNLATYPNKGEGYKGSKLHAIREGELLAGGDYINGDGRGGLSSYDTPTFNAENYKIKHYGAGWVSSDYSFNNPKKHTSLFIITLKRLPQLDNSCVVFGKVLKGMIVVRKISKLPVRGITPVTDVIISNCGAKLVDPPFFVSKTDATY